MKINQNDRKRKFFGQISYEYEHNANSKLTEKDFRESVIQRIKDYCKNEDDRYHIIFHDKDLKDDGSSKPLHAHFYIDFKHAHTYSSVFKALSISRKQNLEFVRSSIKACRYLTHRNERNMEEHKFPYEVADVISSENANYIDDIMGKIKNHSKEKADNGLEIDDYCLELSYLISEDGLLTTEAKQQLFEQFSQRIAQKAWNSNKRQFEENRQEFIHKEFIRMSKGERSHTGIYIQAEGGTGKSYLARLLAEVHDRLGAHTPSINKKRFDLGSGYKGEKTIVINELDASCGMTFRELFQVLEPDSATQLSSRFKDAYIINDLTIITNSDSYWDWCDSWFGKKNKEYHQLMRRIRFVIKMVHDEKNKVIKIELWNYTAKRDLKEKAKQAFKKLHTYTLNGVENEDEFRKIASDILERINKENNIDNKKKVIATTSTDQSKSCDN